jgi:cytochrome c-type biogenesis protein CcmH
MRYLIIILLTAVLSPLAYADNQYNFNNAKEEKLFRELTAELRCPKCQNQNIADSDAIVAKDLRNKVFELVQQGSDKDQIIGYMVDRYGYFVHYKPPLTPLTLSLWLLPFGFVILGFAFILYKQKTQSHQQVQQWTNTDEQKFAELLAKYKARS